MPDAAYYRAWRAAHPEYRARQNRLRAERRRRFGREDRSREYARCRERRAIASARREPPSMPALHQGHELFELARRVVGPRRTSLANVHDPLHDDLLSEATLALIEGRDPGAAVRAYSARERAFGRVTCPLFEFAA